LSQGVARAAAYIGSMPTTEAATDAASERVAARPLNLAAGGVALLLGLLTAGQGYFMRLAEGETASVAQVLIAAVPGWLFWAVAFPLVRWLARRFPLDHRGWRRSLPVHLLVGLALVLPHVLLTVYTGLLAFPPEPGSPFTFRALVMRGLPSRVQFDLIIYFAIVGLVHAVDYSRRLRAREIESARLSVQLAQSQLQALKMQLHPHFLFNTLHAIGVLIHEEPSAAGRMVTLLGDMLRHTLATADTQEVPLGQELQFLQLYLEIERMRFPDRLSVDFHVPSNLLATPVPHFILQPIVENAVRYGISPRSEAGRIEVHVRGTDGRVEIEVWNDGARLSGDGGPPREGVGLATTRARLEKLYQERGGLAIRNAGRGGVSVTLSLPGMAPA
jgi:two-component system, LytTR family, sensor kinase